MIVITTPTGQVGGQVLEDLVGRGEPIRVIARDPSRIPSSVRERIEVVEGASDDLGVVTEAFGAPTRASSRAPELTTGRCRFRSSWRT